jgi:hypothetical protein
MDSCIVTRKVNISCVLDGPRIIANVKAQLPFSLILGIHLEVKWLYAHSRLLSKYQNGLAVKDKVSVFEVDNFLDDMEFGFECPIWCCVIAQVEGAPNSTPSRWHNWQT